MFSQVCVCSGREGESLWSQVLSWGGVTPVLVLVRERGKGKCNPVLVLAGGG